MSALLGLTSFGTGMLPLSISFSRKHLSQLSTLGTGLLLGTALGVILPEGIETLSLADPGSEFPTTTIALSLLVGFSLMLVVEQLSGSHSHSGSPNDDRPKSAANAAKSRDGEDQVEFDVELGELEDEQGIPHQPHSRPSSPPRDRESVPNRVPKQRPFTLTIGLVLHGLADGLALGVSALSSADSTVSSDLSFVVFFALAIHKAPTALAFTTSLMATSLPRIECRKHLAVFSASTPIGAIASYAAFSFVGAGDPVRVDRKSVV